MEASWYGSMGTGSLSGGQSQRGASSAAARMEAERYVIRKWSPDGSRFMTATTASRLQIDNGIKIFDHNGSLQFKKMFENKLYQPQLRFPACASDFYRFYYVSLKCLSVALEVPSSRP